VEQRNQRKKRKEDKSKLPVVPRKDFQKCDSAFPTHLTGKYITINSSGARMSFALALT
jgi:hypothetical protein